MVPEKQARNLQMGRSGSPQAGIAALVYDKRGAGKSGGEYEGNQSVSEKNISLLADDALADAASTLANHPSFKGEARRTGRHQPGGMDRAPGRGTKRRGEIPGGDDEYKVK